MKTPQGAPRVPLRLSARHAWVGLASGLIVIALWAALLTFALTWSWAGARWALAPVVIAALTFLYTGLFITAHDAMHGTAFHLNRRVNDALGALCVRLYAMFSYRRLREAHHAHHASPASADDPDYHDGEHPGLGAWYVQFLRRYVTWRQLLLMAILYNVFLHLAGVGPLELTLFWVAPSLLSTTQLFYFGTYLPHRAGDPAHQDAHRARSNAFAPWLSFLTCYHFGYHWEHHACPQAPWWSLPALRRGLEPRA